MFNVYRSNRLQQLADAISHVLVEPLGPDLSIRDWIGVPSRTVEEWLKKELATRLGIFAGAQFSFPRALVEQLLSLAPRNEGNDWRAFGRERLTWSLMKCLPGLIERPGFADLLRYARRDGDGVQLYQLCRKLADSFDNYAVFRPHLVLRWEQQRPDQWQSVLWNALVEQTDAVHIATGARVYLEAVSRGIVDFSSMPRVCLFANATLPPLFLKVLSATGESTDVHLFAMSPSKGYWAHTQSIRGQVATDVDPDRHMETGNPLLASMGSVFREFQAILEEEGTYHEPYDDLYIDPLTGHFPTLLRHVKSDLLHFIRRAPDAADKPQPIRTVDSSCQVHACASPMREAEVLRDRLLALFDDRSISLRPEQVLVLVPDMETYAPFIEAAFEPVEDGTPAIPFHIQDTNSIGSTSAVRLLRALLDLASSRVTVAEVFSILRLPGVADRFDLSESDVDLLEHWVSHAGVRWGIDAAHREFHSQPGYEQNTWRFGLKRLFLGYAMPTDEAFVFNETLPFDDIEGMEATCLGGFASFLETLFTWIRTTWTPRSAPTWHGIISDTLDRLLDTRDLGGGIGSAAWDRYAKFSRFAEEAGYTGEFGLPVLRIAIEEHLNDRDSSPSQPTAAVTFAGAMPMRTVPSRVVCLMGMGYRDFPRFDAVPGFDLAAKKRLVGDRSRRADDQHTFISAILCAEDTFIITYTGRNAQDGEAMPASVLVDGLFGALDMGFVDSVTNVPVSEQIHHRHPLHPYGAPYFDAKHKDLFTYSKRYFEMAKSAMRPDEAVPPFVTSSPKDPLPPGQTVSIRDLVAFFASPTTFYLERGLGVSPEVEANRLDEREPVSPDPLDRFILGSSISSRMERGDHLKDLFAVFKAKGVLPMGAPGRVQFDAICEKAAMLNETADAVRVGGIPASDISLALESGGSETRIEGRVDHLFSKRQVLTRFGVIRARHLLELWIRHLVLMAADAPKFSGSDLFGFDKNARVSRVTFSARSIDPQPILAHLAGLYQIGVRSPIRLFPEASYTYAVAYSDRVEQGGHGSAEARALKKAREQWEHSYERESGSVTRVWRNLDPLSAEETDLIPGFGSLSRAVFEPLLSHMEVK